MAIVATSPLELAVYGSLLLSTWYLLHPLFSWNRSIPGPVLAKYTRWWYFWQLYKCDFHLTNKRLHEKYGKIVQVMPGYFTIDDPNTHKTIYSLSSPWVKGESYDAWHVGPNLHNLFSERSPGIHGKMRRKVASMYSMTSLVSYEPYVDHCIGMFEDHLTGMEESKSVVDLAYWFRCYAFDVVSMITFSDRLGFLNKGEDIANLIENVDFIRRLHTFLSVFPWVMPAVHFLRGLLAGNKQVYQQKFASEKIALKRLEPDVTEKKGPICMVKKLIDAQRTDDSKITDFDIRVTAGANVGAGSDTTAITLSCIAFYIYQHPQVLQKLRDEIEGAGLARTPSFHSVQQLAYLQAVIKEATRVYPASGLPLWREVPKGGAVLSGQFFPEGTNVGVNGWVANMNKDIYGPDADEFRPERWLDAEGGKNKRFKEDSYLTFGLGTRTCIGKNISLLEINKLIPVLVRDYDIQFVAPDGAPNQDKVLAGKNIFFVRPKYLHARISKRTSGQNKN